MGETVKIISIKKLTHDVLQFITTKPQKIEYTAGQAVDISIDKAGWENELRTFTFTSLPEENHLEFVIKTYNNHPGVTNELTTLSSGDELILGDIFGDIAYRGDGLFIAGGSGITPFLAIFKQLESEHKLDKNVLLFANKTKEDIILESQLSQWLGNNVIHVLSKEQKAGYEYGYITKELIAQAFNTDLSYIYLCGLTPMMDAVESFCMELEIPSNKIIKEGF